MGDMTNEQTPEQLTLLPPSTEVPVRFRLDATTRRRGLEHVAEIKAQLERRRAERLSAQTVRPTPRRAA
jgi:hypothetical protein